MPLHHSSSLYQHVRDRSSSILNDVLLGQMRGLPDSESHMIAIGSKESRSISSAGWRYSQCAMGLEPVTGSVRLPFFVA